jgi:putative PEP-CTERM system TPR-repeat lipoprotein
VAVNWPHACVSIWFQQIVILMKILLLCIALISFSACTRSPEQRYANFIKQGKSHFDKKDYARATLEFKNATVALPKEAEGYYQLGLANLALGEFPQARRALEQSIKLNPKHTGAQLKLAEMMTTSRRKETVAEAEKHLEQVISRLPDDTEALEALAMAEWRLGKADQAESHLAEAIENAPQDIKPVLALVRVKLSQRDVPAAEKILQDAATKAPSPIMLYALGQFYLGTRRLAQAEHQFRLVLNADPKNGAVLVSLGELLAVTNKQAEAEDLFKRASALPEPTYRSAYATYLFRSGKRDIAIKEFEDLAKKNPSDRSVRNLLVAAYQEVGRSADAERLWREALKKNAKDIDALLQRSRYYIDAGKSEEARNDLGTVLQFEPESTTAHFLLAKVYQQQGAVMQQKQELDTAIRTRPDFLGARIELAKLLIGTKAAGAALEILDQAPALQRVLLPVVVFRSWALLALGRKAEARKGIDAAIATVPNRQILLLDATYRLNDNDPAGARKSIETSLKQNAEDLAALELLVDSYAAQKQLPAAVQALREFSDKNPKSAVSRYSLGQTLLRTGNRQQARLAFEAATMIRPTFVPADLALAELDIREEKFDSARTRLAAVVKSNPMSARAHLLLGIANIQQQRPAEAVQNYRKAVELDASNPVALNNLAYALASSGDSLDEALKLAQRAQEIAPDHPQFQDTLGWILYSKGLHAMAIKQLEKAAARHPSAPVKLHLGLAYIKVGDETRGQLLIAEALSADAKLSQSIEYQQALRTLAK